MLKRGYIILIAGGSLFVIGIALTVVYGINMASTLLDETIVLDNVEIESSESGRSISVSKAHCRTVCS